MAAKVSGHTKAGMKLLPCVAAETTCKSPYQDEKYGKGKRAHNPSGDGFRCTVCGRSQNP